MQSSSSRPPGQQPSSSAFVTNKPTRSAKASVLANEALSNVRATAAELPPALRFYVYILEAADSYRLNSNLLRYVSTT